MNETWNDEAIALNAASLKSVAEEPDGAPIFEHEIGELVSRRPELGAQPRRKQKIYCPVCCHDRELQDFETCESREKGIACVD